ncbi:MAG TPA: mycothiol system anti-sigma-R factor [Propionibacteriaceae bacterium]|nr:mycothiol system anti-sigma-R factor [Propionibacteriaceae bacterium]
MTDEHTKECQMVLEHVQEFLDNELDSATEEAIRAHIAICEPCLDQAEVWMALKTLVRKACTNEAAPESLVSRISLRVSTMRIEKRA